MKRANGYRIGLVLVGCVLVALQTQSAIGSEPIADAGLPRYAALDPVVLNGRGSFDPDDSSTLVYAWRQVSGPVVDISAADTATPTISGFVQTDEIQECEFELVVSDGELTSLPDTVKVIIVPDFGANRMRHVNPPFNPNKPTLIFLGGGDCIFGYAEYCTLDDPDWNSKANVIDFATGYGPDPNYTPGNVAAPRTYYQLANMIIVYLSSVAPDYQQPIQTAGMSTGGQPALDVGIHLNLTYADARYAVNRVTLLDARACRDHSDSILKFLDSSVDGEQCWIDNHRGNTDGPFPSWPSFYPNVLRVGSSLSHPGVPTWYGNSLTNSSMNQFNHGVVGGAYWSVFGPGKNLQLASTPGVAIYSFKWVGSESSGYMDFWDEPNYPGRLPEPVTLVDPVYTEDHNGVILSCEESENAIGYQLIFGGDPYHMVYLSSDTPSPPRETITHFPFEHTWWTVRAYDQYGSTIHADPRHIQAEVVQTQAIENTTTGLRYVSIQQAINDAHAGDEIVVSPGACQYLENINYKGKNLIIRSIDPNDPTVVAATVINGGHRMSTVTFSSGEGTGCLLEGFMVIGGTVGISCHNASPTIRNCTIKSNGPNAIEFLYSDDPIIVDCTVLGQIKENDPRLIAHWKFNETAGDVAYDSAAQNHASVMGDPIWQRESGQVDGALQFDGIDDYLAAPFILDPTKQPFSVFAWIRGGQPGQTIISQQGAFGEWLSVDPAGTLATGLTFPLPPVTSDIVITDDRWHHIGLVSDGSGLSLYVDDIEVTRSNASPILPASGDLQIGAGKNLEPGSFWSGMIDDIRIYSVALRVAEIEMLAR